MTRPCALVVDGDSIKLRLEAERRETGVPVHVDWLRFTVYRRNVPAPSVDHLFPRDCNDYDTHDRLKALTRHLLTVPDCDTDAAAQAIELAQDVASALGAEFVVCGEVRKGHDFYRHRIAIERAGSEVAWVGFGASSESPKQQAQARTLHANIHGAACTFGASGWRERLHRIVEDRKGTITRCDLALDFFGGIAGGMARIEADYNAGLMDVGGRRLTCKYLGDWSQRSEGGRSFYAGSKEAGKQTNIYEKGDQLYGVGAGSKWVRVELRFGNKLRVLPADMLLRPADFFAGASDWHTAILKEAEGDAIPEAISCVSRTAIETVKAEAYRSVRWTFSTAGASIAALLRFASDADLSALAGINKLPQRLRRFTQDELRAAFHSVFTEPHAGDGSAFVQLAT